MCWCDDRTHGPCNYECKMVIRRQELEASLREVYEYMCEVESRLGVQVAVRSYLSLPRSEEERVAIGNRARRLLGIEDPMPKAGPAAPSRSR